MRLSCLAFALTQIQFESPELGRPGKAEDLKGAAVYLASHASDYVHGAIIPVDGAWLAR